MSQDVYCPGLKGVIAEETEICNLDGSFLYRGYSLHEIVAESTFLDVAYLLLFEELPNEEEFADFLSIISEAQELPPLIQNVFEQLPIHVSPLEALRTGIDLLSHVDPTGQHDVTAHHHTMQLLGRVPQLLGAWQRIRNGQPILKPQPELNFVSNLYYVITGRVPSALYEHALDVALMLSAEHEFNPSTYVARIVGSVRSGTYAPITSALDTFQGSAHAGGHDSPLDVLDEVRSIDNVDAWLNSLPEDESIPGFGHPIYKECDPRAAMIEVQCERLAQASGRMDLEQLAEEIERAVWERRRIPPSIDWPLSRLLSYLELDRDLFRCIFALARIVGWSAHACEQAVSGEVIRPRARYRGRECCPFVPLHHR